ncbi:unnamed protein product [Peronospora belbahrii]|uniref:tRNA threonylcarbamoyladenosine biosynthesis protein TsaE n=1 Tax=Peronospora belbahrii TaxID=622444 RepID=A0AAU9KV37_9STRA|nr:unnamed protein product [Peronospora belbahrii]
MDVMLRRRSPASLLRRRCTRYYSSFAVPLTLDNKIKKYDTDTYLSRLQMTRSQEDMEILGERLAQGRQTGDVLFLRGDLGCGKTCLARGFVRAHTQQKELTVTSPTYLLVNTYNGEANLPVVYHVDLYRLDGMTEQDVAAVGLAEAFERGITLIEWPERLNEASVPAERLEVRISYVDGNTDIRRVELQPIGERWTKLFATSIE